MIKEIKDNDMSAVESSKLAIVDYNATWCGPCKMLAPILKELSEERTDIEFFSLDVDANPVLSITAKIHSVPTLMLFKDGKMIDKSIGYSSKEELTDWLNEKC